MATKKTTPKKIIVNSAEKIPESSTNSEKVVVAKKRGSKGERVNINKITQQKLIDEKLRKASVNPSRMSNIVALAAVLGFLVGGSILAYYFFIQNSPQEKPAPQIILPEDSSVSQEENESTPRPAPAATPEAQVAKQQVEILTTPTGFLNVRSGPGTNNPKIGEAKLGDVFDFISEDVERGWYEIRWSATSTAWVTKQYSKILTP